MNSSSCSNTLVASSAVADDNIKTYVLRPLNIDADDKDTCKKTDAVANSPVNYIDLPEKNASSMPGRQRFKMIVFDKDGTLGNDRDSLRRWAKEMTRRARTELQLYDDISTNDIDRCLSDIHHAIGWDGTHQKLLPSALLAAGTWEEILAAFTKVLSASIGNADLNVAIHVHDKVESWHTEIGALHSNDAPIIDDLPSLIRTCQSFGLLVAVCTSDNRKSTNAALDHWNIASLVDYLICGDEVPNGKPSADPLLRLCKQDGVTPQECIVVGDTIADTGMARNAGAGLCIGVLSGSGEREQLMKTGAHWIMPDVGELPPFLRLALA